MKKSYLPIVTPIVIFLVGLGFLGYTYYKYISNKPGALSVTSKYTEASASFRGNDLGETPIEETELKPGSGELVVKTDRNEYRKEVILTPEALTVVSTDVGVSSTFSADLILWYDTISKQEPELFVTSNPTEAQVTINEEDFGETPITIPQNELPQNEAGEYTVLVEKEGYESQKLTVRLEPNYILNVSSSLFLKPIPREVEMINSNEYFTIYGLSNDLVKGTSSTEWSSAIAYWLETRGASIFGGENVNEFDYFVDAEGNLYSGKGDTLNKENTKIEEVPQEPLIVGYLSTNNNELSEGAQTTIASLTGTEVTQQENLYEIIQTGIGYLNVRQEPNVNGELAGQVNVGDQVVVLEEQGDWSRIEFTEDEEDGEAWVFNAYLRQVEVEEKTTEEESSTSESEESETTEENTETEEETAE